MTNEADARTIVEAGYDAVADRYAALEEAGNEWPRMRWLERLLSGVEQGSRVLDVGCGSGVPATRAIAERFDAVGIDVSAVQKLSGGRRSRLRRGTRHGRLGRGNPLGVFHRRGCRLRRKRASARNPAGLLPLVPSDSDFGVGRDFRNHAEADVVMS
jgi:SAM-dependent methyltransferase